MPTHDRKYLVFGEVLSLSELAKLAQVSPSVALHRLKTGWTPERVATTPLRAKSNVKAKDRFGRLVIVKAASIGSSRKRRWRCLCDCGQKVTVREADMKSGLTTSCGCQRRDSARATRQSEAEDMTGFVGQSGVRVTGLTGTFKVCSNGKRLALWLCECACGTMFESIASPLRSGQRQWCRKGCPSRRGLVFGPNTQMQKRFETDDGPLTLHEIAHKAGVTVEAIRWRIKHGMTPAEALRTKKRTSCQT